MFQFEYCLQVRADLLHVCYIGLIGNDRLTKISLVLCCLLGLLKSYFLFVNRSYDLKLINFGLAIVNNKCIESDLVCKSNGVIIIDDVRAYDVNGGLLFSDVCDEKASVVQ